MKDIKQSKIGLIPQDWEVVKLGSTVKKPIVYGIVQAGAEVENGIPYIKSTDVGGDIDIDNLSKTSEEIALKYKRSEVVPGDLVFSLRGNIGELSFVPETLERANLTQGTARISLNRLLVNPKYIYYILMSSEVKKNIKTAGKGSTFQEISLGELRNIEIPLPIIAEQNAIEEILTTWDKSIQIINQVIRKKQKRKEWLLQTLLLGKIRLKGYNKGNWEKHKASDFFKVRTELAPNNGEYPLYSLTIEKGITPKSDRYEREFLVKDKSIKKYKIVYPNDIGFNPANLRWGAIAMHNGSRPVLVSPIYEILTVNDAYDKDFIKYLVSSPRQIAYYLSIVEGTLVERMAVKITPFLSCKYEIPKKEEQKAIANVLLTTDREIELLQSKLQFFIEQKKGLMQILLTGKKRLKVN
jgi:type I restriction enzyme S subunit